LKINAGLAPNMLDPPLAIGTKPIKPQRIAVGINLANQARAERRPLCGIDFTFKHGVLHTLAKVETSPRDSSQPASSGGVLSFHVISYQNQQRASSLFPDKAGITINVSA